MQELQKINAIIPILYFLSIFVNVYLSLQLFKMKQKIKDEIREDYKDVVRQRELEIRITHLERLIDIKAKTA